MEFSEVLPLMIMVFIFIVFILAIISVVAVIMFYKKNNTGRKDINGDLTSRVERLEEEVESLQKYIKN